MKLKHEQFPSATILAVRSRKCILPWRRLQVLSLDFWRDLVNIAVSEQTLLSARQIAIGVFLDHRILTEGACRGQRMKSDVARPNPALPAARLPVRVGRRNFRPDTRSTLAPGGAREGQRRTSSVNLPVASSWQTIAFALSGCPPDRAGRPSRVLVSCQGGRASFSQKADKSLVTSDPPGSPVSVDGVSRGSTPFSVALRPGLHEIGVGAGAQSRGQEYQRHEWRERVALFSSCPKGRNLKPCQLPQRLVVSKWPQA